MTSTVLAPKEVIEHYSHLWQIEKAFRISKTDLRIRPIFHYKRRRIEAHMCIAFVAYAIWKELERLLDKNGICMSPRRAADLTHTIYEIEYTLPQSKRPNAKCSPWMLNNNSYLAFFVNDAGVPVRKSGKMFNHNM